MGTQYQNLKLAQLHFPLWNFPIRVGGRMGERGSIFPRACKWTWQKEAQNGGCKEELDHEGEPVFHALACFQCCRSAGFGLVSVLVQLVQMIVNRLGPVWILIASLLTPIPCQVLGLKLQQDSTIWCFVGKGSRSFEFLRTAYRHSIPHIVFASIQGRWTFWLTLSPSPLGSKFLAGRTRSRRCCHYAWPRSQESSDWPDD